MQALFYQAQTRRTGGDSSQVNFKTHFIFCIFPVNEPKLGVFAQYAPEKCYIGYFFKTNFLQNTAIHLKYLTLNLQNFGVVEKTQAF